MEASDLQKIKNILEDKCCLIGSPLIGEDPADEVDMTDLDDDERAKVYGAWKRFLASHGIGRRWDARDWRSFECLEGHVMVDDQMVRKGTGVLDVPQALAEKLLLDGTFPEVEKVRKPRKKHEGPIVRAPRNSTQYVGLATVTASEDGRRIVFVFNNGTSLFYNVAVAKWFHSDTELEMGDSHFGNIQWGEALFMPPPAPAGHRWEEFKPGRKGFYEQIAQVATEGWVKLYFTLLSRWAQYSSEKNRREDGEISKRVVNRSNRLDMLTGENSMAIESLAKNQYIQQMPLKVVCGIAFDYRRVNDFKAFRDRGMDTWFCKHVSERANTEYVISDHAIGLVAEDRVQLGAWLDSYNWHCQQGDGDLWRYVWEKYKFAISRSAYQWSRLKKLTERGFKAKKVMDYALHMLPMQGISETMIHQNWEGLVLMDDYARMQHEMTGGNYERYPKCLKMSHDIAARNYRVKQSQAFSERFASICESIKGFEFSDKEFSMVLPLKVNDIVNEGAALNHCVAAYVSRVIDRQCSIVFLRKTEELDKPLVTVEIGSDGKTVVQARGHSNRDLTEAEQKFLAKYRDHLDPSRQKSLFNVAADLAINPELVQDAA